MNFESIFAGDNRGILPDVVVFLLNPLLMRWLTGSFVRLAGLASAATRLRESASAST